MVEQLIFSSNLPNGDSSQMFYFSPLMGELVSMIPFVKFSILLANEGMHRLLMLRKKCLIPVGILLIASSFVRSVHENISGFSAKGKL